MISGSDVWIFSFHHGRSVELSLYPEPFPLEGSAPKESGSEPPSPGTLVWPAAYTPQGLQCNMLQYLIQNDTLF